VFLLITGDARKPAKTAQERAELFTTLIAYTGTYRVEADKWTTKVDVSWIPEWVGTDQVRTLTVDGERLTVMSPWRVNPNWPDKGMTRSIVAFALSK
jgi:Lipocalin-like domain